MELGNYAPGGVRAAGPGITNVTVQTESVSSVLEQKVLRAVLGREHVMDTLRRALRFLPNRKNPHVLADCMVLANQLRVHTIEVAEAVSEWRRRFVKHRPFVWKDRNYLLWMICSGDWLDLFQPLIIALKFHMIRNPLVVPILPDPPPDVDALEALGAAVTPGARAAAAAAQAAASQAEMLAPETRHLGPLNVGRIKDAERILIEEETRCGPFPNAADMCSWCGLVTPKHRCLHCDQCKKRYCPACSVENLGPREAEKVLKGKGAWQCFSCADEAAEREAMLAEKDRIARERALEMRRELEAAAASVEDEFYDDDGYGYSTDGSPTGSRPGSSRLGTPYASRPGSRGSGHGAGALAEGEGELDENDGAYTPYTPAESRRQSESKQSAYGSEGTGPAVSHPASRRSSRGGPSRPSTRGTEAESLGDEDWAPPGVFEVERRPGKAVPDRRPGSDGLMAGVDPATAKAGDVRGKGAGPGEPADADEEDFDVTLHIDTGPGVHIDGEDIVHHGDGADRHTRVEAPIAAPIPAGGSHAGRRSSDSDPGTPDDDDAAAHGGREKASNKTNKSATRGKSTDKRKTGKVKGKGKGKGKGKDRSRRRSRGSASPRRRASQGLDSDGGGSDGGGAGESEWVRNELEQDGGEPSPPPHPYSPEARASSESPSDLGGGERRLSAAEQEENAAKLAAASQAVREVMAQALATAIGKVDLVAVPAAVAAAEVMTTVTASAAVAAAEEAVARAAAGTGGALTAAGSGAGAAGLLRRASSSDEAIGEVGDLVQFEYRVGRKIGGPTGPLCMIVARLHRRVAHAEDGAAQWSVHVLDVRSRDRWHLITPAHEGVPPSQQCFALLQGLRFPHQRGQSRGSSFRRRPSGKK